MEEFSSSMWHETLAFFLVGILFRDAERTVSRYSQRLGKRFKIASGKCSFACILRNINIVEEHISYSNVKQNIY